MKGIRVTSRRDFILDATFGASALLSVGNGLMPGWKPGDDCMAVFRPERPDIATFRPRPAA
jgi:hypothetical protein